MNILLIEDNKADVRLIEELLKKSPGFLYDLESYNRLSEGLDRLEKKQFNIILLDLTLPDSDKQSTLENLIDLTSKIPIIVLTGLDDKEIALNSLKKGFQDYLVKGEINQSILTRAILYAIERHKIKPKIVEDKYQLGIDEKDKLILNILQENYKISYKEISNKVGLAASTIHNRVQSMLNEGIIQEFDTFVDPFKVGYNTIAIVGLSVDPLKINQVSKKLAEFDEIQLIASSAGEYNIILQIIAQDEKELWRFINEKLKSIEGIRQEMNVSSFIDIFKMTHKIKFKIQ
ncbi:MAG: response regulator [Candidatus Lokiarchaeota archaeon]|nr:response regulator [Candidatus Lokiarchaeota archaeon]